MVEAITINAFKSNVLAADHPVLVDFFATWCGPCRTQAPILDRLSSELRETASVYKVDVDAEPDLARMFQIQSIPTLLVFKDGKITNRFVGLTDERTLKAALAA